MIQSAMDAISNGVASSKLKDLGLSEEQAKKIAPVAVEINSLWKDLDKERRMIRMSLENIQTKSSPVVKRIIKMINENKELKQHVSSVIGDIVVEALSIGADAIE